MVSKLGDLFVNVSAKGVGQVIQGFEKIETRGQKVAKALNIMKTAFLALGAGMVIRRVVKDFLDYGNAIDKANKTPGIATKTLQRLRYAAEQEHTSFEQLTKGMNMLVRRMQYVQDGLAEGVRAFDRIGVFALNADGSLRVVGDVFTDVADKVANAKSETEASAIVLELLGRSGYDDVAYTPKFVGYPTLSDINELYEMLPNVEGHKNSPVVGS